MNIIIYGIENRINLTLDFHTIDRSSHTLLLELQAWNRFHLIEHLQNKKQYHKSCCECIPIIWCVLCRLFLIGIKTRFHAFASLVFGYSFTLQTILISRMNKEEHVQPRMEHSTYEYNTYSYMCWCYFSRVTKYRENSVFEETKIHEDV